MNQKEIRELIEFLIDKDIAEFELERGDVKLRVKRGGAQYVVAPQTVSVSAPVATAPQSSHAAAAPVPSPVHASTAPSVVPEPAAAEEDELAGTHVIQSPIVGTFYESPSPGAPPFVKPGDSIAVGQVLCIVEAMKLMNEIESDYSGTIVKRFVQNGQPVEYGQKLFAVKP
jgi:acetyl-CoA carboxylase biotin carboxyl carrier protein